MSHTKQYSMTDAAYAQLTSGVTEALIQMVTNGPVRLVVAQSQPAADSSDFIVLSQDDLRTVSITGMESGDAVYARAGKAGDTEWVAVMANGSAFVPS